MDARIQLVVILQKIQKEFGSDSLFKNSSELKQNTTATVSHWI
jgi:hypothetical protein